jgi:hypothetical protein
MSDLTYVEKLALVRAAAAAKIAYYDAVTALEKATEADPDNGWSNRTNDAVVNAIDGLAMGTLAELQALPDEAFAEVVAVAEGRST